MDSVQHCKACNFSTNDEFLFQEHLIKHFDVTNCRTSYENILKHLKKINGEKVSLWFQAL